MSDQMKKDFEMFAALEKMVGRIVSEREEAVQRIYAYNAQGIVVPFQIVPPAKSKDMR